MRPVAIFDPKDEDADNGLLVVGDRDRPEEAMTLGPMSVEDAAQFARRYGFEFELLR